MRVTHLTIPNPVQTVHGQLKGTLTDGDKTGGGFEMFYLSGKGLIEINRKEWAVPVYHSVQGCVFSTDEPLRKT